MQTITDLPVGVVSEEDLGEPVTEPEVGQTVVIFSRNRYRHARVTKVGPKRVTAEYTTPGAIDQAYKIASINREAQIYGAIAEQERQIVKYEREAELIEAEGIEVTEHKAESFVPLASLPPEYAKLDGSTNLARTTIVFAPAKLRQWAQQARDDIERKRAALPEAKAEDARPLDERAAEHVKMTTKAVSRDQVWAVK